MTTFILGFVVLALIIAGMSVGVLMGRRPITGSCGGVGAALGEKDYECDLCGGDPDKCETIQSSHEAPDTNNLSYDATNNPGSNSGNSSAKK